MKSIFGSLFFLIFSVGVTACTPAAVTMAPDSEVIPELMPYYTATLTPTPTHTPEGLPTSTPMPTVTPTPRVYKVQANDTLLGIANFYGLTLAELQAANPGVQPALLAIGTELIIPVPANAIPTVTVATALPFAVKLTSPQCVLSLTGGYHCFALATNEEDFPVENLAAEFILSDPAGGEDITRQVLLPLNHMEAGASLPFYTYFAPPVFADARVAVNLLSASQVQGDDAKFTGLVIVDTDVSIAEDGTFAAVSGSARLSKEGIRAVRTILVAVAYDVGNNVVGLRRVTEETGWSSADVIPFSLSVYSTGGRIARVEVLGEAE